MVITTPHYQTTYTKRCNRLWALVASACVQCPPSTTLVSSWTPPWTCMARSRASSAPCSITCAPSATSDASWTGTPAPRPCCLWWCPGWTTVGLTLCWWASLPLHSGRLQLAQNYAARLVMGLRRRDHVSPALDALHWLPIHQRVCYKPMCLLYKTLYTDDAPVYMSSVDSQYTPGRALHSASATVRLAVPRTRLARAGRCFSVSTPALWNVLPPHLHHCSTFQTFKTNLLKNPFILATF